jgi:hypothetical protein
MHMHRLTITAVPQVTARVICFACVRARREGRPWGCGCEWDRVLP